MWPTFFTARRRHFFFCYFKNIIINNFKFGNNFNNYLYLIAVYVIFMCLPSDLKVSPI